MQRAAHSKGVARKKPIPKNRKVKSGGHARVPAGTTKKSHPNTYVSIGHTALLNERSRRRTVVRTLRRIKIKTDEGKTKRTAHSRRSKGRRRKYLGGSTARPAGNAKIRGGAAGRKTQFSGTFRLPRLGKDARGSRGQKSRKCLEKKSNDREYFLRYVIPSPK